MSTMSAMAIFLSMSMSFFQVSDLLASQPFVPEKFSADFEQSFVSSLSGKTKKSSGVLKYLYPGHLWLEVLQPEKEKTLFISNLEKSWYYTPPFDASEAGEVVVQPANKFLLSHFFDTLKKGLATNKHYTVKRVGKDYQLNFSTKTAKEIGVKWAQLTFSQTQDPSIKDLKNLLLHYQDQREVNLSFSKLNIDEVLQKKDFVFAMPEKVKVIEHK